MPITKLENFMIAAYFRIKFKDIFDLKEFYSVLHDWLMEYEWESVDSNGNLEGFASEYWETMYLESEDASGVKDQWWWWRLQKVPSKYYKYHLDIDIRNIAIATTEVVREGKKLKVNKGEIELKVWAIIEYDYKGEWSKNPILKPFREIFHRRIFFKDLYTARKLELYREAYILNSFIKRWFKINRFLPFEEVPLFHPSGTYPAWKPE